MATHLSIVLEAIDMSMLLKFVREGLGRIILLVDWITRPSRIQRSAEQQARVQTDAQKLSLYQHNLCPFCIKTRRTLHQLNVPVEIRELKKESQFREDLLNEGGQIKVPCLRIEKEEGVHWMYESKDIIRYLQGRFGVDI